MCSGCCVCCVCVRALVLEIIIVSIFPPLYPPPPPPSLHCCLATSASLPNCSLSSPHGTRPPAHHCMTPPTRCIHRDPCTKGLNPTPSKAPQYTTLTLHHTNTTPHPHYMYCTCVQYILCSDKFSRSTKLCPYKIGTLCVCVVVDMWCCLGVTFGIQSAGSLPLWQDKHR